MTTAPKISAILLAAGLSRRLGQNKLLLNVGGEAVVRRVAKVLLESRAYKVIIVTGHEAGEVRAALEDLDLHFTHNPRYEEGQGTSLVTGLRAAALDVDGYLFALGDQALLTTVLVDRLITSFSETGTLVAAPFHQGRRGNPVLFSSTLREELLTLGGDEGARSILRRIQEEFPERFQAVEAESEELFWDLDNDADYKRLLARLRQESTGT